MMTTRKALLLLLVAVGGCNEDLLNPMADRQPRVQTYAVSDFYDDGLTMRDPPAGTVPRERVVLNAALSTGKTASPTGDVYVTQFPMKVDRPLLALGQRRFNIICATCHGPIG